MIEHIHDVLLMHLLKEFCFKREFNDVGKIFILMLTGKNE